MMNNWTRQDLPDAYAAYSRILRSDYGDLTPSGVWPILDLVVEHLNAHHPKPTPGLLSNAADCVLDAEDRAKSAKADVDRWRRAHEIVERERDQARRERDAAVRQGELKARTERDLAEAAERERDEWKARAEAAEARTAPAVSRADIDRALINVTSNAMNYPTPSQMLGKDTGPLRKKCVDAMCDLLGIEAEQAVDPVEAKAIALWRAGYPNSPRTWEEVGNARDAYRRMAAHVLGQEAGQ